MNKSKVVILFDIDYTLFNTERFKKTNLEIFCVYEDGFETLEELSKIADLGIFSEGDIAFQNKKLREPNIEKYFIRDHMHIVKEKVMAIKALVKKYKNHDQIFLIDDRLAIFPILKKEFPSLFTIWMKRESEHTLYQIPMKDFSPDAEVETLKEIIPLIRSRIVF